VWPRARAARRVGIGEIVRLCATLARVAVTKAQVRSFLHGEGSIAVAMGIMSAATFGFTFVAAHLLGPRPFGAIASLMNVLLVVNVLSLGLQATAARRISAEPEHVAQIERVILSVTYRSAIVLGLLLVALAPVISDVLRLHSLKTAAMIAVTAVPLTIMGGQAGILQGERRWWPLGVIYIASGVPRFAIGTALMLWHPTEAWAMLGVTIGAFFPVLFGAYALRHERVQREHDETHGQLAILRETGHNSQALLAFFTLSNLDIVLARNLIDSHDAGLYAGGLILTKCVLFLPQFVVVIAFPSMSTAAERRRALLRSLTLVALLGVFCTAGVLVLHRLALIVIGGTAYVGVESKLWLFAVLGTLLSMLQLLVYAVLARQGRRSTYVVWLAVVALVVVALSTVGSLTGLLVLVTAIDGALLTLLLGLSLWHVGKVTVEPVAV
jgi:O-antigen/teichoic acid export membrane protein